MKNRLKCFTALLLSAALLLPCFAVGSAAGQPDAALYTTYGDSMLFQQNEEAIFAGTAAPGSAIHCELINAGGECVKQADAAASADGTFRLSFVAPAGGYDAYTVVLTQNGEVFATLRDVVFGELWLAGGQSNMHLFLRFCLQGIEMMANGQVGSEYVRFLDTPLNPTYNGNENLFPDEPQADIPGARWVKGNSADIFNVSAVAYAFAEKLQKDLDMPVGVLTDYLGGTLIRTWLSRKGIESNPTLQKMLGKHYIPSSAWKENDSDVNTATALYNKKTAPLANFRPAGFIWYQGESDSASDHGFYTEAFAQLQKDLTELFGRGENTLPAVISLTANHSLIGLNSFQKLNAELGEIQQISTDTRALISISDIPLDYTQSTQTVHPYDKQPVGARMATAAQGLVYKKYDGDHSAPVLKSARVEGSDVFMTFTNVADGLAVKGDVLRGFTVCGKDGVLLPADASLVSADTVKVHCDEIEAPVAAMYAQGLITTRCNLCSLKNGEYYLPACSAITDWQYFDTDKIWQDFGWTDCDTDKIWREETLEIAGYYDIWQGENADVTVSKDGAFKGDGGLVISGTGNFSVGPVTTYTDSFNGDVEETFAEFMADWRDYGTFSVMLKNNGTAPVTVEGIKIYTSDTRFLQPVVQGTRSGAYTLPADGEWHKVTYDLGCLKLNGKNFPFALTNRSLKKVKNVSFCFGAEGQANVAMDELRFSPAEPMPLIRWVGFSPLVMLYRWISGLISK